MSYQRLDNFQTALSAKEIEDMRGCLQSTLGQLRVKKNLIHSHDYHNLVNHLEYSLGIFNNMVVAKQLEQINPNRRCNSNPYQTKQTVVYAGDGSTTTIVDEHDIYETPTWQKQFEENVLNPPMYNIVPTNVFNIQKLKNINI